MLPTLASNRWGFGPFFLWSKTMELITILYVMLIVVSVIALLSGLMAALSFNWTLMAMFWTFGIACILAIGYLENEL
tara:strand:+ start:290 stop:520 length:231 start_codon:yes stop_codon:yes gene_type:complete